MMENLRQYLNYSKEFRIEAPKSSVYSNNLEKTISTIKSLLAEPKFKTAIAEDSSQLTIEIATTIWRLKRRLSTDGDASDIVRRSSRDIESMSDSLQQSEIEIKDYTGQKYDDGMALQVLAFQPIPGLNQKQIIETIKPTIFQKNKTIQVGQVIVGVPEKSTS
jgi:hypothetical protein